MKISNLISFLDKTKTRYGDLEVVRNIDNINVILDEESMYVDKDLMALHIE